MHPPCQDYTTSAASDYPRCFDTVLDATAGCPPSITHQIRCSYIHTVTVGVCTHAPDTGLVDWSMCRGLAVFNKKHQRMNAAAVGIVTQLFIALLIFACFQLYSADVRVLVVNPIEAMVGMVRASLQPAAGSRTPSALNHRAAYGCFD